MEFYSGCVVTVAIPAGFDKDRVLQAVTADYPGIKIEFQPSQNDFLKATHVEIPKDHLTGGARMQDPETGQWKNIGGASLLGSVGAILARLNDELT